MRFLQSVTQCKCKRNFFSGTNAANATRVCFSTHHHCQFSTRHHSISTSHHSISTSHHSFSTSHHSISTSHHRIRWKFDRVLFLHIITVFDGFNTYGVCLEIQAHFACRPRVSSCSGLCYRRSHSIQMHCKFKAYY